MLLFACLATVKVVACSKQCLMESQHRPPHLSVLEFHKCIVLVYRALDKPWPNYGARLYHLLLEEGCLSLPKQYAEIERPEEIKVEYLNSKNEKIIEKKNGLEARVLQHEIDHLHGKLFVDYLSSLKRNKIIKRVKKLVRIGEI